MGRISLAGGIFALLVLVHFIVDWMFQTHNEVMRKHNHAWVRARHCLIYMIGVGLVISWLLWPINKGNIGRLGIAFVVLFMSHFIEDTYWPVYIWARYIRRPPEMDVDPKTGFVKFIETTLGKILMITIDQIIHVVFLWFIVWWLII